MNPLQQTAAEHQEIWELLPWFVNDRLSEADCARVEEHLRLCADCRDECAAQRQICSVMAADSLVEHLPMAGLNKLRQRLQGNDRSESDANGRAPPRVSFSFAACVAGALAIGIAGTLLWKLVPSRGDAGSYYTVTSATLRSDAVIRAVFAPDVRLSELQALLSDAHLRIVAGPTEAGMYSLGMTGTESTDWSLQRLRGNDTVRFAEPIGPPPMAVRSP